MWWEAEVTAEWWVGICLGPQRSAFLDMVEGLLFQEYHSILQVEPHCISDTSVGPGLGALSLLPGSPGEAQAGGSFKSERGVPGPSCMLPCL